jgi:hypothetical protein
MTQTKLPRVALDGLTILAGEVTLNGKVYGVKHITSGAWRGARKLQEDEVRRQAGEKVSYDLDAIFDIARALVTDMPDDVKDSLTAEQATAILMVANERIAEVEALFSPKAGRPALRGTRSPRPTR